MPPKRHTKKPRTGRPSQVESSRAARASPIESPARPSPPPPVESTPVSSAYPSAYPSDAENDQDITSQIPIDALTLSEAPAKPKKNQPFRFMDLPLELRLEVYLLHFDHTDTTVDLDSDNYWRIHKNLAILGTSRAVYAEASRVFYSAHTFRVFPTQPGRHFKTKKPLLARLKPRQRAMLTSLELRLGPGWNKPPRGWVVNPALGLADCINVRRLTVFVECDPSDTVYKGFRKADGFYETFSSKLLDDVLGQLPWLDRVHFDAWSGVKKSGGMMGALLEVAAARGKKICWGPERQWTDCEEIVTAPVETSLLSSLKQVQVGY